MAYPGFCRCVRIFYFVCVCGWGLGVGWGNLPLPPKKQAREVYALRFVRTSSYATGGLLFVLEKYRLITTDLVNNCMCLWYCMIMVYVGSIYMINRHTYINICIYTKTEVNILLVAKGTSISPSRISQIVSHQSHYESL